MHLVNINKYVQRTKIFLKTVGKDEFFFERVAMAFPKDSPWIPYFDKIIKKVVQGGLVQRWKQVRSSQDHHGLSHAPSPLLAGVLAER